MHTEISRKKIIFFSLILLAVVLLILSVSYCIPRTISSEAILVSSEKTNEVASISYSLTIRNSLIKPTEIIGSIVFNDVEYVNMSSLGSGYDYYESNSVWKNLQLKYEGFRYDLFVRADAKGNQTSIFKDTVTIVKMDEKELIIAKSKDTEEPSALYTIPFSP